MIGGSLFVDLLGEKDGFGGIYFGMLVYNVCIISEGLSCDCI